MNVFVASVGEKRRYSYEGGAPTLREKKFEKALGSLIDRKVGLFLSANQFVEGLLLDVKRDHVIMNVNQNVCYFALQHIQAISNNAKDFHVYPQITPYLDRNYLVDVLMAMRYNWVTINSLSNQETFGVLSRIAENHIMLINNTELVNIPKSYISTIYSEISEEQIISLNRTEHLAIQQSDLFDMNQEDEEQPVESSQDSVSHTIDETKEQSESLQEEIEVENERQKDGSEQEAIQDFILHMNAESIKQSKSQKAVEIEHSHHDKQVAVNQQPISNNKLGKNNEHLLAENPIVEETAGSTIKNENSALHSKLKVIEESDLLLLDKYELMNSDGDYSFERNREEVSEPTENIDQEERMSEIEPQSRHNEKRILISAWSAIHNEQHTIAKEDNLGEESEYLLEEDHSVMEERDSDEFESLNNSMHDTNADDGISDEKSELAEITSIHIPVRKISLEEEKEMLKMQYYALMIHAAERFFKLDEHDEPSKYSTLGERNTVHIPISQISRKEQEMLERQYYSLMKYAEKRYRQMKDLGLQ